MPLDVLLLQLGGKFLLPCVDTGYQSHAKEEKKKKVHSDMDLVEAK
jgi:hypothetical protein